MRAGGAACGSQCRCQGCKNVENTAGRHVAVAAIRHRYGKHAFETLLRVRGCGCSDHGACSQLYCLCRKVGRACSDLCGCPPTCCNMGLET